MPSILYKKSISTLRNRALSTLASSHEGKRRLGRGRPVGLRKSLLDVVEPVGDRVLDVERDLGIGEVRVDDREVTEGGRAHGEGRLRADSLGGLGDSLERGDGVGGSERGGSSSTRDGDLGVAADDGDGLGRRSDGEERLLVLEENDGGSSRLAEEGTELRSVDRLLLGVEGDSRSDGAVGKLEQLQMRRRQCPVSDWRLLIAYVADTVVNVLDGDLSSTELTADGGATHGRGSLLSGKRVSVRKGGTSTEIATHGHLEIESSLHTEISGDDSSPIGHDQSLPAPLAAKDLFQDERVLGAVDTVNTVVCDRQR